MTTFDDEDETPWADPDTLYAIEIAARNGLPPRALATYARWWQLETWLRELVYVELRAKYGAQWTAVTASAAGRQSQDAAYTHMENADSRNPLAYLDYSQLLTLIEQEWALFDHSLLERRSWDGRQSDLMRIRHRIGHMRVPHRDDLSRLEQTLRDLEQGAFVALFTYNDRFAPKPGTDPVTDGWLRESHPVARRLLDHADQQYGIRLSLQASRRPWAREQQVADPSPGILWHADFLLRSRTLDASALWRDTALNGIRPIVVHMVAAHPGRVGVTFSAADDGSAVADAIGVAFDAVLTTSRISGGSEDTEGWGRRARAADFRVINGTGWNIVDSTTLPISIFGTGAGVRERPYW